MAGQHPEGQVEALRPPLGVYPDPGPDLVGGSTPQVEVGGPQRLEQGEQGVRILIRVMEPVDPEVLVVGGQRRFVVGHDPSVARRRDQLGVREVRHAPQNRPLVGRRTATQVAAGLGDQGPDLGRSRSLRLRGIVGAQELQKPGDVGARVGQLASGHVLGPPPVVSSGRQEDRAGGGQPSRGQASGVYRPPVLVRVPLSLELPPHTIISVPVQTPVGRPRAPGAPGQGGGRPGVRRRRVLAARVQAGAARRIVGAPAPHDELRAGPHAGEEQPAGRRPGGRGGGPRVGHRVVPATGLVQRPAIHVEGRPAPHHELEPVHTAALE